MPTALRLAHLSDWHATTLAGAGRELLQPKRLSGWASWKLSRRHRHSPAILAAAIRDVQAQSVDRVLVSGDLTHVSLESEFKAARQQLETLGAPERVCVIPGNHDCYVPVAPEESWDHWADYLRGDPNAAVVGALGAAADRKDEPGLPAAADRKHEPGPLAAAAESWIADPASARAPVYGEYPRVWLEGEAAVIGLCSAIPMPTFRAGGRLGEVQLARLARLLRGLGERGFARVVMLHHPVIATDESARRALQDGEALREVLEQEGAELVLHGHKHRRRVHWLDGPEGAVPIIGVPSSSEVGSKPEKRAQYHVYSIRASAPGAESRFRVDASVRGYDPATQRFVQVDEDLFARI